MGNAGILDIHSTVHYEYDTIDNVISLVKKFGKGCLLAKMDIEDAFSIIPVHPNDYHLLGFTWNNLFYYDRCLSMGASSSCTALQWIMENRYGASGMSHILDNFLFVGPPNSDKCKVDLTSFLSLCKTVGIPIKTEKTEWPTPIITIYGFQVDSIQMECRLPVDKLHKMKLALQTMRRRRKVTLRELQSLIGLLNFVCTVICRGRAFLRRLIDLTMKASEPYHFIRLNTESHLDMMQAWLQFLQSFNGNSVFLHDEWLSSDHFMMYTDASGTLGYAAIFGRHWFAYPWVESMVPLGITIKELFPIVLALELWGIHLTNHKVLFMSDNQAVVQIINKQSCREPTLMKLVRRLVLAALTNNIYFRSAHITGKENVLADKLSRFKFQEALLAAPWLDQMATVVAIDLQST